MLYIKMATHSFILLRQNQVLEIIDDVTVMSFCEQPRQNFVFLLVIPLYKIRAKSDKNKEVVKREMTSFLKIAQHFFVRE